MLPTNDIRIDALVGPDQQNPSQPAKWNVPAGGTITYSFVTNENKVTFEQDPYNETGVQEVDEETKNQVRNILGTIYQPLLPLNFVEDSSGNGIIRIMLADLASSPNSSAYVSGDAGNENNFVPLFLGKGEYNFGNPPGSFEYSTLIHELGHAMGLEHPGNYNASGTDSEATQTRQFLPFEQDNTRNTVMSYNPGSPTDGDPNAQEPRSLMPYDILALNFLYGTREVNPDNTVYRFDNSNFQQVATISDTGGIDTIDVSALNSDVPYYFNLVPGEVLTSKSALNTLPYTLQSSQGGPEGATYSTDVLGTYTAFNTLIENIITTGGDDEILGNGLNNDIQAGPGNDTLTGGRGSDNLKAGAGDDVIFAGRGFDQIIGGAGDDTISAQRGNDVITGGEGSDRFILGAGLGTDTITDYQQGVDQIALLGGLTFAQLTITPQAGGSAITVATSGEVLAILPDNNIALGIGDFVTV